MVTKGSITPLLNQARFAAEQLRHVADRAMGAGLVSLSEEFRELAVSTEESRAKLGAELLGFGQCFQDPVASDAGKSPLQIVLAEYSYEQKRHEGAVAAVNQAMTVFIAVMGLMATTVPVLISKFWDSDRSAFWGLSCFILGVAGSISTVVLLRIFQSRLQQTHAERAMSRLRRYFVDTEPRVAAYLSGTTSDDWPTPYTQPWRSHVVLFLSLLVLECGTLTGAAIGAGLNFLDPSIVKYDWKVAVGSGSAYSLALYFWLFRRLRRRRIAHVVRFPSSAADSSK